MTRPLADRVKEALFAILEPSLRGVTMLDLFAGSGAGGIEALSRGASGAVFVERDSTAVASIRANLERTHLAGAHARVVQRDVGLWLAGEDRRSEAPFGLVFVDPPYDQAPLLQATLEALGAPGFGLDAEAIVVAKHFWRDQPVERIGLLASERVRRFGDTALTFYRVIEPLEART